jgi:septal ring factor EnvC (AmiA/AmiB activator)
MINYSEPPHREVMNVNALVQSCALRVSLATLLAQTAKAEATIKYRIAGLEQQAQGLRTQLDQTTAAIESLRRAIASVDDMIRRLRDESRPPVTTERGQTETEREKRVEDSNQGRRSGRRKGG